MLSINRNAEAKLVEMLGEIEEQRDSWTVVFFHLNRLLEPMRNDYHLKIAVNLASDLLYDLDGSVFTFSDGGLAVMCRHLNSVQMNKLVFQMRYLYMDDPLAYSDSGQENPDFCTIFRLFTDYPACVEFATQRMMMLARRGKQEPGSPMSALASTVAEKISPSGLARIERQLETLDITQAIRRQPVCAIKPGSDEVNKVFDELYIRMHSLRELLQQNVDLLSNKWLFKYITQLLDAMVVSHLKKKQSQYLSTPLSLNLNVSSLLSDWFQEFDKSLNPAHKVAIIFEVPVVDLFDDMHAFLIARDEVQKKGYRICIDGLTNQSLLHIDRSRLQADLLKLQWNADVISDLASPQNKELIDAIARCGSKRIILCRCDSKQAVDYGQALNISLFQGRYLDGVLNPDSVISN